jgi:Zn-dependent protease with chaperone function
MDGAARLPLQYFDGRSARARSAQAWIDGDQLHVHVSDLAEAAPLHFDVSSVTWPERQRHGQRQALLPGGGLLVCADAQAWDAWVEGSGRRDSWVVRLMQSWRAAALAGALILISLFALWRWGAPLAANAVVRAMPEATNEELGRATLTQLDEYLLKPSQLSETERTDITQRFGRFVAASPGMPRYELAFRDGGKALGPNAFALPGHTIVLTDALVVLMRDHPEAIMGVLGHEMGHLRHRHATRQLVQASLLGLASGLFVGDYSTVMAGAPVLFAQMAYSRDFEREADAEALAMLRAAGLSPQGMVLFFERLAKQGHGNNSMPIAFSSHPADEERIRFFGGSAPAQR